MKAGSPPRVQATLPEQSSDVLLQIGTALYDPLRPHQLASLCATCKAVKEGLSSAAASLRQESNALSALLAKTGYSVGHITGSMCPGSGGSSDLCWYGKSLDNDDCLKISQLIRSGALEQLESLRLSINQISDAGVEHIASALTASPLPNLKRLWLSNNLIGCDGMACLVRACAALPNLRALYLHNNAALSPAGLRTLGTALGGEGGDGGAAAPLLCRLETLWLDAVGELPAAEAEAAADPFAASPAAALARGALPALRWLFVSAGSEERLEEACGARGVTLL